MIIDVIEPLENSELNKLRNEIRAFVTERDWEQFHTPKNLACALSVEAAELLEHFQWLRTGSKEELGAIKLEYVQHEIADVLVNLIRLADNLDIDLIEAVTKKMIINRMKYPVEMVRGDSRKYSEY